MVYASDPTRQLDFGDYKQKHSRLVRLARKLPSDKVESLAREAIRRLIELGSDNVDKTTWETRKTVERLCAALVDDDEQAAARMVVGLNQSDLSPEAVYIDYLAAAARRLNEWWEHDKASFWQITVAGCRLLAIMRSMSHLFEPDVICDEKSAIFAGVPGEQHTVGLRMATDIFRKDGWHVVLLVGLQHDDLVDRIGNTSARVIGLSISSHQSIEALSKLIVSLHICRPNAPIFLNGNCVKSMQPKLAWMDLAGVSDDLMDAKAKMNGWIASHEA